MSINKTQLLNYIIKPTLDEINMNSESAQNLLLGTCAQESQMGTFLRQLGNGPALGIYQMEPNTHDDIWHNYILYKPFLKQKIEDNYYSFVDLSSLNLIGNLWYATLMTRLHYARITTTLPDSEDIEGLANYWKAHYNTPYGKGTPEEFISNYKQFVLN